MSDKRYYWLKMRDDFFSSTRIKKLRKIAGGDTYTIIYLKMQLLSVKNGGVLKYEGYESSFAEELALDLDEEPENVAVTLQYLLTYGLAETSDNVEYLLPFAAENIGTESESAKRVRAFREKQKALLCNGDVTNCNTDKDINKEIDSSFGGAPPEKKSKKKPIYDHTSIPYRAAKWLSEQIMERLPEQKAYTESDLQRWADDFRLMNTSDGYEWELIEKVLQYSQEDYFWSQNILSASKFRKQFSTLLAKAKASGYV